MKKLFLLVAFLMLVVPQFAKADHPKHHRRINGTEFSIIGLAAAVVVGGAGYFLLRRRKTAVQ